MISISSSGCGYLGVVLGWLRFLCSIDVTLWFGTRLLFPCGIDCCDCLGFGTGLLFLCSIDVTVLGLVLDFFSFFYMVLM